MLGSVHPISAPHPRAAVPARRPVGRLTSENRHQSATPPRARAQSSQGSRRSPRTRSSWCSRCRTRCRTRCRRRRRQQEGGAARRRRTSPRRQCAWMRVAAAALFFAHALKLEMHLMVAPNNRATPTTQQFCWRRTCFSLPLFFLFSRQAHLAGGEPARSVARGGVCHGHGACVRALPCVAVPHAVACGLRAAWAAPHDGRDDAQRPGGDRR